MISIYQFSMSHMYRAYSRTRNRHCVRRNFDHFPLSENRNWIDVNDKGRRKKEMDLHRTRRTEKACSYFSSTQCDYNLFHVESSTLVGDKQLKASGRAWGQILYQNARYDKESNPLVTCRCNECHWSNDLVFTLKESFYCHDLDDKMLLHRALYGMSLCFHLVDGCQMHLCCCD